jgi:hypothetical protein
MNNRFDNIDNQLQDINVKVMDFNVFDMFKGKIDSDGGHGDELFILIQNLEKKLMKKFEFVDEKVKKSEEEAYKIKNDILGMKNNIDINTKTIINHKEQIDIIFAKLDDINTNFKNSLDMQNNNLKDLIDKLRLYFEDQITE